MGWFIGAIGIIVAVICIIKLQHKQHLDIAKKNKLEQDILILKHNKETLQSDIDFCQNQISKEQKRYKTILDEDNKILAQKAVELDEFYDKGKTRRLEQLENEMALQEKNAKAMLEQNLQRYSEKYQQDCDNIVQSYNILAAEYEAKTQQLISDTKFQEERYVGLLAPLQQYEKDRMEKLFYTIQVPDEYKEDINYLLNTVAGKVQHPDIINKLIWAEYVKPYIDDTFKRVGIEPKPGIYKLTNIDSGKAYIGKSTDVKKRISDHMRSSIGIQSIADQAVHHAILDTGFWNWTIEIITYCEKDRLSELEKYYIDFFQTQTFGFNKNIGG